MLNKLRSNQGFTLIELLIVVAIIGILAAIAIPQFSKYRIQGFNASANSDIRNLKTSEESLYAEHQRYGATEEAANAAACVGTVTAGVVTKGGAPVTAGNLPFVSLVDGVGTARAVQVPVGNNVTLAAVTIAGYTAYNGASKHVSGDTAYGVDSDSTINFKFANWPTAATAVGLPITLAAVPAPVAGVTDFALTATTWAQM